MRFIIRIQQEPKSEPVPGARALFRLTPRSQKLAEASTVSQAAAEVFRLATAPQYLGKTLHVYDVETEVTTVVEGQASHLRSDLDFYKRICAKIRKNADANYHPEPPSAA